MSRRGKQSSRSSIDNVLDDLLGSDTEDAPKKANISERRPSLTTTERKPANLKKPIKLNSNASDAEFYKNLKSLGGEQINDNYSEEEELSDSALQKVADDIGDLDDLDNDLFAGLTGSSSGGGGSGGNNRSKKNDKKQPAASKSTPVSKKKRSVHDLDDPLSGLGLSEDDEEVDGDKQIDMKKTAIKKPLTRRLSGEKKKIEPSPSSNDSDDTHKSLTTDLGADPFITSNTRRPLLEHSRRTSSWDSASENEVSPRGKQSKAKSRRKMAVEPTKDTTTPTSQPAPQVRRKPPVKPAKVQDDDLFGDDDGLPGFSDDEDTAPKKITPKKSKVTHDEDIPDEPAANALSNLLGGSKERKKVKEPTMLDQIMSGKKTTPAVQKVTEPDDLLFGGYSPSSAGNSNSRNRPTTAPNSRSVRFADDLGLDLDDNGERPATAPERKVSTENKKKKTSLLGVDLDSSLDESGTWQSSSQKNKNAKEKKEQPTEQQKDNKKKVRKTSNDDWLGLGEDMTDELSASANSDLFSPRQNKNNIKPLKSQADKTGENNSDEFALPWEISPVKAKSVRERPSSQNSSKSTIEKDENNNEINSKKNIQQTSTTVNKDSPKSEKELEDDFLNSLMKKKKQKEAANSANTSNRRLSNSSSQVSQNTPREQQQQQQQQQQLSNPEINTQVPQIQTSTQELSPEMSYHYNAIHRLSTSGMTPVPDLTANQGATPNILSNASTPNLSLFKGGTPNFMSPRLQGGNSQQNSPLPIWQQEQQMFQIQQLQQQLQEQLLKQQQQQQQQQIPSVNNDMSHLQSMKESLQKELTKQQQDEFNATKRQFERDKSFLETELQDLQQKVIKLEESKSSKSMDYAEKIRELEAYVRKLELERDQLLLSHESLQKRQKDELKSLEISHNNRMGFLEDSYKRREEQLKDETDIMRNHSEEKNKALLQEKVELMNNYRKKIDLTEKNNMSEIERLKQLHKTAINDLVREHNEQLEHLKVLKEQEISAAVNAFSHTKSLQSLIAEVHNSTREVSNLQTKLDSSHQSKLNDRELSLKSRDEYLKNLENRLQQQEIQNDAERERLQGLVSKLEVQLREQSRQIEQDKWKISQDENKLKAMQAAFEEERRTTNEQLVRERQQLTTAREAMLAEQKTIITECYEEKRRITNERSHLTSLQTEIISKSKADRTSALQAESDLEATLLRYQHESSSFNIRLAQVKQEEERLKHEKDTLLTDQKQLKTEYDKLHETAKKLDERSKEIEDFAKVSIRDNLNEKESHRIGEDGRIALAEANAIKAEFTEERKRINSKSFTLEAQEKSLEQDKQKLITARQRLEQDKAQNICVDCRRLRHNIPTTPYQSNIQSAMMAAPSYNPYSHQQQQQLPYDFDNQQLQTTTNIRNTSSPIKRIYAPSPLAHTSDFSTALPVSQPTVVADTPTARRDTPATRHDTPTTTKTFEFSLDSLHTAPHKTAMNSTYDALHPPPYDTSYANPPDLLANNFEFDRAVRRWSTAKEKDDDFFEEETKYLKKLHNKRITTL